MQLTIELTTNWELIEPTGDLLRRAAVLTLGEGPVVDMVMVASRELLENTVKYSTTGDAVISLWIMDNGAVRITAENEPAPEHIAALKKEIEQLSAADDSLNHYLERMAVAAKSGVGKSGLGLARIRHECGMTLTVDTVGKRVRISALRAPA